MSADGFELVGDDGSRAGLALLDASAWSVEAFGQSRAQVEVESTPGDGQPEGEGTGQALAEALAAEASRERTLLVCLVRRGGWSVGVVRAGVVLTGKTGRRYVQGTTAAGGWSQQRFARRRGGQTDKLADDASTALVRMMEQAPGALGVVVGGDQRLAESVLAGTPAERLPVLGPLEVGEPRRADLDTAATRVLAVRVTVHDAP